MCRRSNWFNTSELIFPPSKTSVLELVETVTNPVLILMKKYSTPSFPEVEGSVTVNADALFNGIVVTVPVVVVSKVVLPVSDVPIALTLSPLKVFLPVDVLNAPLVAEKSTAPVAPLAMVIDVDGVVPDPKVTADVLPPMVTAPVDVLKAPLEAEKSTVPVDPVPMASPVDGVVPDPTVTVAPVPPNVMAEVLPPMVTAPVDVLNKPVEAEKSTVLEPLDKLMLLAKVAEVSKITLPVTSGKV